MTQLTPVDQFARELAPYKKTFESVLPAHIEVKKFMRTIVGAVQNNPDILKCNRQSILNSCQKAAQDGLVIDGREAALVQFKGQAQYMPMVNGVLKKLRNSGQISTITAETVHQNDPFKYNPAMDDVPNHSPEWFGDRGEMIGVYAVAKMKDGSYVVEIMNMKQIDKVKSVSRSANSGSSPWKQWPEEMAKKTVLRRIAKYLPSSADIDQMFDNDNENYDLSQAEEVETVDVKPDESKPQTKAAQAVMGDVIEAEVIHDEGNPPPPSDDDII